jgi:predicted MFS family arabinose efflux permease
MTVLRLSLVFLVVGLSIVFGLWAIGSIAGRDVADASVRLVAVVAIGAAASFALTSLFGRRPPSAGSDSTSPPANGPRF